MMLEHATRLFLVVLLEVDKELFSPFRELGSKLVAEGCGCDMEGLGKLSSPLEASFECCQVLFGILQEILSYPYLSEPQEGTRLRYLI